MSKRNIIINRILDPKLLQWCEDELKLEKETAKHTLLRRLSYEIDEWTFYVIRVVTKMRETPREGIILDACIEYQPLEELNPGEVYTLCNQPPEIQAPKNNAFKKEAALLSLFEKAPVIKAEKIHYIIFLLQCLGTPFGFNFPFDGECYSPDLRTTLDGLIAMGCIRRSEKCLRPAYLELTSKGKEFLEMYRTYAKLFNIQTIDIPTCLEEILKKKDLVVEAAANYVHLLAIGLSPEEAEDTIAEEKCYLSPYLKEARKLLKMFYDG